MTRVRHLRPWRVETYAELDGGLRLVLYWVQMRGDGLVAEVELTEAPQYVIAAVYLRVDQPRGSRAVDVHQCLSVPLLAPLASRQVYDGVGGQLLQPLESVGRTSTHDDRWAAATPPERCQRWPNPRRLPSGPLVVAAPNP